MKILIGGGGTGGHIYPALALSRFAQRHDSNSEILFVGSEKGLENKIVPSAGFNLRTIPASGFQRSFRGLVKTLMDLAGGMKAAGVILKDFRPDVVLGTGGYVAAPLVIRAALMRYPVVIHEQNAIPGLTNRLMARFSRRICLSFAETGSRLAGRGKTVFTGNPRASEVVALSREESSRGFGLNPETKTVLVYGGSRGALKLNQVVTTYLEKKLLPADVSMIYVTGDLYYREVSEKLSSLPERVKLFPYLDEMPAALAAADLAVTRSGATTLAEITALGIPAILIPSPNVVDNHQYYNARLLYDRGAAVLIEEKDFDCARLSAEIESLFSTTAGLSEMAEKSRQMGVPDAAERLYRVLQEVAS
jgi:UDP-N-acetylglucosamine--N-acetylmuramyl-(pentapeptide) pyrophosphoryl-undecaprenol N-acetylglucosamine transferase